MYNSLEQVDSEFQLFPKNSKKSKKISTALEKKEFKTRTVHAVNALLVDMPKGPKNRIPLFQSKPIGDLEESLSETSRVSHIALKNMLLPSLPRLLQDIWVFLEVTFAILLFVLTTMQFVTESKTEYAIASMVLACLDIILASLDGIVYFKSTFEWHYYKIVGKLRGLETLPNDKKDVKSKFVEKLNQWFELGRTLASEVLLYPLIIADLIGFVYEQNYTRENLATEAGRRDFILFIVSNIYLLVSVHVMRLIFIIQTVRRLNSMPVKATGYKSEYVFLTTQFGITGVLQILTSIIIVAAVGVKIAHEEQYSTDGNVHVSPFLWAVIVTGWYLPVLGILCFFFVNYYWIHEFSMSYFIDLMSMLQGESFAEAVFGGESEKNAEEKAGELVGDIGLAQTKAIVSKYRENPSNTLARKLLYPSKNLLIVFMGFFYNFSFIVFIACLFIHHHNSTGEYSFVLFEDDTYGLALFILGISAIICNLQTMLVICYWIFVVFGFVFFAVFALVRILAEICLCVPDWKRVKLNKVFDSYLSLFTG